MGAKKGDKNKCKKEGEESAMKKSNRKKGEMVIKIKRQKYKYKEKTNIKRK
jgi:hypothetical protein